MTKFKMPKSSRRGAKETPLDLRFVRTLFADSHRFAKDLSVIAGGRIQDIAAASAREIGKDATRSLIRLMSRPEAITSISETLAIAADIIGQSSRLTGRALADAAFAAEAGSAALIVSLAGEMSDIGSPPAIPPAQFIAESGGEPLVRFPVIDEAVRTLQESNVMPASEFYAIARDARDQAFTISDSIAEADLERVRQLLEENVAAKTDRQAFVREARERVETLTISDAHLEQVFRNNVNDHYSEGVERVLRQPLVEDQFPYRAYYAIRDDRVRDEHLQLEQLGIQGTNVYHRLDPVWEMFRPPWDWNCRCGFTPLSVRQAARKGIREAQQWLDTGIEPEHEFVPMPKFEPSPSWQRRAA